VGMTGEMADIIKTFIVGDTYDFDIEQFKGKPDINLNKLIGFYDELENLMNSLSNINGITDEELDDETE
jgi:predicted HicB family RNase H-like nuclease